MDIVDAQIHPPTPGRGWDAAFGDGPDPLVACELAVAAMDAVGVDAALVSPSATDPSDAFRQVAVARYPERFRFVVRVGYGSPELTAREVAAVRDREGVLGLRVVVTAPEDGRGLRRLREGDFDGLFASAERAAVPTFLLIDGALEEVEKIAERYPDLLVIVDHLGLRQPPRGRDREPFIRLPSLLKLSKNRNVAVKLSGVPTLSSEPFPYRDLWPYLHRVIDGFGAERVMWGSDFTRCSPLHSYVESLYYLRGTDELSERQKESILGGTLRRLLRWPAGGVGPSGQSGLLSS